MKRSIPSFAALFLLAGAVQAQAPADRGVEATGPAAVTLDLRLAAGAPPAEPAVRRERVELAQQTGPATGQPLIADSHDGDGADGNGSKDDSDGSGGAGQGDDHGGGSGDGGGNGGGEHDGGDHGGGNGGDNGSDD